ncbi:hypothetical protein PMI07_000840 [Rhizobium sp. CF080]|uniref:hypothetical protein n=1 Tax=Rhizobium sp. (strain CF080) TaxID=1144310 RepID=UPI000271BCB6|nr:hypothetical protein [Rhizobium sp. CF080]EUB97264.1 hypothetical protein PMI07_000840 [Rhizobium sp. CF080]
MESPIALPSFEQQLDAMFGCCDPAGRTIEDPERHFSPQSLQRLDEDTAPLIRRYMELACDGLRLPGVLHRTHPMLWLIDKPGDVWTAIEEVIDAETGAYLYPLSRSQSSKPGHVRLGHPSLVIARNKHARIGGEIKYSAAANKWIISNRSGRYGTRPNQTQAHLAAAASRFMEFDIELTVSFWQPGNSQ